MEDDVGLEIREGSKHLVALADVADLAFHNPRSSYFQHQIVHGRFRLIDRQYRSGLTTKDLTHQLRADGTGSSSYHDAFAPEESIDRSGIQLDRRPPQEVFNVEFPDLSSGQGPIDPVPHRRYVQ